MVNHYRTVRLNADFIAWVERAIDTALEDQKSSQRLLRNQLTTRFKQLSVKADNLIDLVAEGGLASARAAAKIREIGEEKERIEKQLATVEDDLTSAITYIRRWLKLLTDPRALYENASDATRRRLNQAIFKRIWVVDRERAQSELSEPAQALLEAQAVWQDSILSAAPMQSPRPPTVGVCTPDNEEAAYSMHDGNSWSKRLLVGLDGIEPSTKWL